MSSCAWPSTWRARRHALVPRLSFVSTDQSPDEVDRLVSAWERQRPDLDVSPFHVLSRVTRLARHLDIARREAFADHDIESGEFDVLSTLRRSGQPYELTPSQLLAHTLVTSGTMTNRIDRLVEKGLVSREPDPRDGRGVLVRLTERGKVRVDAALTELLERERELLRGLSDEQRQQMGDMLRTVVLPFDQDAEATQGVTSDD